MKIQEKHSPEKQKLVEASDRYQRELRHSVKSISKDTEQVITNALFIGGALALTYFVVTQLTDSKPKKKKRKQSHTEDDGATDFQESGTPNILSQIGDVIVTQATAALLELAKEKLTDYLKSRKSTDEHS